ncbi:MAG: hypothetical protein AB7F43_07975 [Bacteriovoracia bacterium]
MFLATDLSDVYRVQRPGEENYFLSLRKVASNENAAIYKVATFFPKLFNFDENPDDVRTELQLPEFNTEGFEQGTSNYDANSPESFAEAEEQYGSPWSIEGEDSLSAKQKKRPGMHLGEKYENLRFKMVNSGLVGFFEAKSDLGLSVNDRIEFEISGISTDERAQTIVFQALDPEQRVISDFNFTLTALNSSVRRQGQKLEPEIEKTPEPSVILVLESAEQGQLDIALRTILSKVKTEQDLDKVRKFSVILSDKLSIDEVEKICGARPYRLLKDHPKDSFENRAYFELPVRELIRMSTLKHSSIRGFSNNTLDPLWMTAQKRGIKYFVEEDIDEKKRDFGDQW